MKKVIIICLLVVTLLVGGMTIDAKTTKRASKAKTTQTKQSPNVMGKVKVDNMTYNIMKNVTIVNPADRRSKMQPGWWKESNGAYVLCDNFASHGESFLGVIYNGTFYMINRYPEMQWVYFDGKPYVSFNASNKTVTYRLPDDSTKTVSLSQVSSQDKSKVTWY